MSRSVLHLIPMLFGGGRRLFDILPSRPELEIVRVIYKPGATYIRHRILHWKLNDARHSTGIDF